LTGGAGSVAHYAIQFAKLRGTTVVTTVCNDEKAARARRAADCLISDLAGAVDQRVVLREWPLATRASAPKKI
jgi:NADPH2:quinone reductase